MSSDKVFWYEKNGEKHCCFTASELKALALSGEIDSSCLIWKEGTKNWIPAASVKGLLPTEPPAAPLQDSIPPVDNVSPEHEQERTAEPPNSPDEADSSDFKNSIIQKFQNLDLINRWKSLSLDKKILCIAAIVSAFAIGLFNLFVLLIILLPVLWFIALFKPSVMRADTRMQATKRFAFSFIFVVVGASILAPAKNESSVAASPTSVSASPDAAAPAADVAMPETVEMPVVAETTPPDDEPAPPDDEDKKEKPKPKTIINGILYATDGTPFTGVNTSHYPNGQVKEESHYENGIKEGLMTVWYSNGQKSVESNYKDGKPDGEFTTWYETGQKNTEGNNKDGESDGLSTKWYESGEKLAEIYFKNGKQDGLSTMWSKDGEKIIEKNYKDGEELNE